MHNANAHDDPFRTWARAFRRAERMFVVRTWLMSWLFDQRALVAFAAMSDSLYPTGSLGRALMASALQDEVAADTRSLDPDP